MVVAWAAPSDRALTAAASKRITRMTLTTWTSLAHVLREELGLTGTKIACNEGHCGACTVQIDGVPRLSCITLAHTVEGEVTTIEGLREHPLVGDGRLPPDARESGADGDRRRARGTVRIEGERSDRPAERYRSGGSSDTLFSHD